MKQLFISEWERTFKRKKTMIGILLYVIITLFMCYFLHGMGNRGVVDPQNVINLNSLNAAPYLVKELSIFLHFIFIPMLIVDSFQGENHSGALRMVLIRPYGRWQLFFAKWSVFGILLFILTLFAMIIGLLYAQFFTPQVDKAALFDLGEVTFVESIIYTVKFYGLTYFISLTVMGLGILTSSVMPNPILSYVAMVTLLIGGIYVSEHFEFLFTAATPIFYALSENGDAQFYMSILVTFMIPFVMNLIIWKKRSWSQ